METDVFVMQVWDNSRIYNIAGGLVNSSHIIILLAFLNWVYSFHSLLNFGYYGARNGLGKYYHTNNSYYLCW